MLPSRPDVDVYAPSVLFAGQKATAEIVIDAKKATNVEYIDARLTGYQGWQISGADTSYGARVHLPELSRRVMTKGVLPAGTSRFRLAFALPASMPPSHRMAPAFAMLELYVRVAIPWWPDGKFAFHLPVRMPPPREIQREPYAIRSSAAAGEPRIELSLASKRLIAGETVVGSVALFHFDDRKAREVELTLVPSFRLYAEGRKRDRRGNTLVVTIEVPAGSAGTSVPFQFKLPPDLTPSFKTVTHELGWWLIAQTGSLLGKRVEVSVPLEIYDASAAARTEKLKVAPRLSDARIEGAFDQFCQRHGWRRVGDDRDPDQLVVERDAGHATLRLGYAYREAGSFLIGRVGYPLGLGLDITPSTPLRQLLSKDLEIDLAEWDRAHHVTARSAEQTIPFLRAAVPAVQAAAPKLGVMRRWTDDEIVFERSVLAIETFELGEAGRALENVANALGAVPLPPPPGLNIDLDDYRKLAQRLAGRLTIGDLSIAGTLDQLPVDVALEWTDDREPHHLRVQVGDPAHAPPGVEGVTRNDDEWPNDVVDVRLEDGVASALLMIDERVDVARVRELVFGLRAWLERLRHPDGPYR